jgi:hypothetical protein
MVVTLDPSMDVQRAVAAHPPGTVFAFTKGVFRNQRISPLNDQQFRGVPGQTILSGSIPLKGWTRLGGYWLKRDMPAPKIRDNGVGKRPFTNDPADLWVDRAAYARVHSSAELRPQTWYFDTASLTAFMTDDPRGHGIEINNTASCFEGDATGVVLSDLIIENYANPAQQPVIPGNPGWQVHNCVARRNHGVGLGVGVGGAIIGGQAIENGQLGVTGSACDGARVNGVEIVGNNYAGYDFDWEAGGLKIVAARGVEISNCRVSRNQGVGIWGDIDCSDWLCRANEVIGNDQAGILFEISRAGRLVGNRTIGNGVGGKSFLRADIVLQNSHDCEIAENEVEVAAGGNGIAMTYEERGNGPFGRRETRNNLVSRNRITHNTTDGLNGIDAYQDIEEARRWSNHWNNNTYLVPDGDRPYWRFFGTEYDWAGLRSQTSYEREGSLVVSRTGGR